VPAPVADAFRGTTGSPDADVPSAVPSYLSRVASAPEPLNHHPDDSGDHYLEMIDDTRAEIKSAEIEPNIIPIHILKNIAGIDIG
jgi:hypothetical protein